MHSGFYTDSYAFTYSRQEFILLSDVFGVSALVDTIDHPKVDNSTESTVLGPFFTEDAHDSELGMFPGLNSESLFIFVCYCVNS
jgi:hypothetical protein